jgi:cell division protein FtsI (penicillin-binding protein 3)
MPRHDATNKVVNQSLHDIDQDISPLTNRRVRTNTRYTSMSVDRSNVSPLARNRKSPNAQQSRNARSARNLRSDRSKNTRTVKSQDAKVIKLHDSKRTTEENRYSSRTQGVVNLVKGKYDDYTNRSSGKTKKVIWYPKKRARLFAVILLAPFLLIMVRLVDVQIVNSEKYTTLGVQQRRLIREIVPERGTITDRNGNILAVSEPAYSIVADPSLIKDDSKTMDMLEKVVIFNEDEVTPLLANKKSRYAMIARQVDESTADRIKKRSIPGISIIKDPKRTYPSREVAPNVIGFVGNEMNGLGGLEFSLQKQLAGVPGKVVIERDPKGREIPSAQRDVKGSTRGNDVALTLDEGLQYETQRIVLEEVKATGSKGGIAIVADVETGEILSMTSIVGGPEEPKIAPATDRNYAVTDVYEPGSTNKVITISGALEKKVISANTSFRVEDSITYDDTEFADSHSHEPMIWNARDILRESSNVGTILISNKLKKKNLDFYLRAYGFGSKSALNFPGEAPGILLAPEDYSDTSIATVPIGNGLAVTAIQMLSVYMTIGNDGLKVEPKLIQSFINPDGSRQLFSTGKPTRVISESTAKTMQSMLKGVVDEGTGKLASVPGYSVGGKTGTARKPPYDKPPYKYIASFAGFAPVNDPKIATIVILDEPQGQIYGGTVAAPVFSRVMQSALRVMAVAPDQQISGQSVSNSPSITTTTTLPQATTTLPRIP